MKSVLFLFLQMLKCADCTLLEPIMQMEIVTVEESSSAVLGDLSRRRSEIKNVDVRGKNKVPSFAKLHLNVLF